MPSEVQLRSQLLKFAHLCYQRNLLVAMDGNLSVRLSSDRILCTKAGWQSALWNQNTTPAWFLGTSSHCEVF